ncbi:MAG TPA: hypothetical protein VEV41_19645 [Terriglobales bacterium]|nr:hypothetical protein [Terriglobales bacterium]
MKKHLFPLLALLLLFAVGSLHGQTGALKATIPFAFTAGDITLPAGEYRVTALNDTGTLLVAGTKSGFVSTHPVETTPASASTRLVFHQYGNHYFLYQIWVQGENLGRELPKTPMEKEVARNGWPTAVAVLASK